MVKTAGRQQPVDLTQSLTERKLSPDSEGCMRTTKTLKPGQKGTRGLVARYGASLLMCAVPLRRSHPRESEDRGIGRPAALSGRGVPGVADAWRPGCFEPEGGAPHRLAGKGPAAAGQVRRRLVGAGQAGLDAAARRGQTSGPAGAGRRGRFLDMGTRWLVLGTAEVPISRNQVARSGNQVPRCRRWWLYLGTARDGELKVELYPLRGDFGWW